MTLPRVEVITSVERRRRWSLEEKERLVAASFEPGVTASEIARSAGIHVSQLFRWRKDLCRRADASVPQLVPAEIVPAPVTLAREAEAPTTTAVPPPAVAAKSAATIHAPAVQVSSTSDAAAQTRPPKTNRGPQRMVTGIAVGVRVQ